MVLKSYLISHGVLDCLSIRSYGGNYLEGCGRVSLHVKETNFLLED